MRIKFGQDIIDFVKKRIVFPIKDDFTSRSLERNIAQLKDKKIIKVAFLHIYSQSRQDLPLFEAMLKDDLFDPYFIINPDVCRTKEHFDDSFIRPRDEFIAKYGKERVLEGYNYEKNEFFDFTNDFDLASTSCPYDQMKHKYFKTSYWESKGVPVFYSNYAYDGMVNFDKKIYSLREFKLLWKIFTENVHSKNDMISCGVKNKKIEVAGYAKLDNLKNIETIERRRKKIIIAPHHTIFDIPNYLNLGSFLMFYDLILELPKMYPNIDFVFRPHGLLIGNLKKPECWGEEKTEIYLKKISEFENVEYQKDGDYLETFVNSDALIHDCGSFLAEYFYTNHPQLHMFRSQSSIDKEFTIFGKEILNYVYKAFSKQDIIDFIDNVVIKGEDTLRDKRLEFAKKEIRINYPEATKKVLEILKKNIGK